MKTKSNHSSHCPSCNAQFSVKGIDSAKYCPVCGGLLQLPSTPTETEKVDTGEFHSVSLVQGHEPGNETVQFSIGPYKVINSIGKGGMGEVLLAYDTTCGRRIALKRIRPDLVNFRQITNRFLKEARVTSQLTHPSIIPIYSIHQADDLTYYTMPYVEGETLKEILRLARLKEKSGERPEQIGASIPALIRIFISICQAVAYSHSKSVLHRDLKPENIIIGKYGEVLILDWGLAKLLSTSQEEFDDIKEPHPLRGITLAGKVVGTVAFMAPERALGQPATEHTDIYSLGVILYQILTLRYPFRRGTLKEFRENMSKEVLIDPIEAAPYRDIPKVLAQIAIRCLATNPAQRYQTVDELIKELESYIEGRSEWFHMGDLDIFNKNDWEFREHILIAEHSAISRTAELSEWVDLMISKDSFSETIRIETELKVSNDSTGIAFLFNVPEAAERERINDGYCLWIGVKGKAETKLLRSSIEVLHMPDIQLTPNKWHKIAIEKVDTIIRLYIDGVLQLSYISRMPLAGTHVGVMQKDAHFEMKPIQIFMGSQNIMVNCLAIPDALLANKNYHQALSEYRRIGYTFAGRAEGREALLRAGLTLLEEAKNTKNHEDAKALYDLALVEFEKLHNSAGAPLEYLGKALAYEALNDIDEEIKCFELGFRRYPHHPLLHTLEEQAIFRLLESSRDDRLATYHFLLLGLCHIEKIENLPPIQKLISQLKAHWEHLEFFLPLEDKEQLIITLAFWLKRTFILEECIHNQLQKENPNHDLIFNSLIALIQLREDKTVVKLLQELPKATLAKERKIVAPLLEEDLTKAFHMLIKPSDQTSLIVVQILFEKAIAENRPELIEEVWKEDGCASHEVLLQRRAWALLLLHNWDEAQKIFEALPLEKITQETSLWFFLYGCWLYGVEGKEISDIHWASILDTPFPKSFALAAYKFSKKLGSYWDKRAFEWEKIQLTTQLTLYKSCRR